MESLQLSLKIKKVCGSIVHTKNIEDIHELRELLDKSSDIIVERVKKAVLSCFYPIIKDLSDGTCSLKEDGKRVFVDALGILFDKSKTDNIVIFFNIYVMLIMEIYCTQENRVLNIHEEYKLSIMKCACSLAKSLSSDLYFDLYKMENAKKLGHIFYISVEIAKKEQLRSLRIAAIECIMSFCKVLEDGDFEDLVLQNQVADIFLIFSPGVTKALEIVALEDEKVGHKLPKIALKALGRIINQLMQNYEAADQKFEMYDIKTILSPVSNEKIQPKEDITSLLKSKRTPEWCKQTDQELKRILSNLKRLSYHNHYQVRLELVKMAAIITKNCYRTMHMSIGHLIEVLMVLSEDEYEEISKLCQETLNSLSDQFFSNSLEFQFIDQNLVAAFNNAINNLPRIFNGIDEREQLAALNLLIGYVNLLGKYKMEKMLNSASLLTNLMQTLLHICELDKSEISLLEENFANDFSYEPTLKTPWKKFRLFNDEKIQEKLEVLCQTLSKYHAFQITTDYLLEIFLYDGEYKKEATFLINELTLGIVDMDNNFGTISTILHTYIDEKYWNLPFEVKVDHYGNEHTLSDAHNNIVQICLQTEGIGKIALALKEKFNTTFLIKTLFLVMTRAGSAHPHIRMSGTLALSNMCHSGGFKDISDLFNKNMDYFTRFLERQLAKMDDNENVINILNVVLKFSNLEILDSLIILMEGVLVQSCDKFKQKKADTYLRIFKIFIDSQIRWFKIEAQETEFKTRAQKQDECQGFQVSKIEEINNFSDDIMDKTAEELYKEDMEKNQKELEDEIYPTDEQFQAPESPSHIKLTTSILQRSVHFLPSKNKNRKLLALQILKNGLELIRNYENDLLPTVHQIWSPLVDRFAEFDEPIIINYSFQLLVTIGRLAKDFIRSRSSKDVLPNIVQVLNKLSNESYLKDKGSAYRYTQSYKLQIIILENLHKFAMNVDLSDQDLINLMEAVFKYLSDKQPKLLQNHAANFFLDVLKYEPALKIKFEEFLENTEDQYSKNVELIQQKS